ncbi:hypothetical protein MMC22_010398 [Lobaria immixta]|nr:hypothetical protein [Lobaria immixta]
MGSTTSPSFSAVFPTSTSSLHFPVASNSISHTLTALHKSAHSTHNRLVSIYRDAEFVGRIASMLNLPLIANERCGSWYIPPERKAGSAYFKSTDGHFGEWAFSKRRLNQHVLGIIGKNEGCIIIDSTRQGKSMPDALSKTIPIWCAIINRALFEHHPIAQEFLTPTGVVGESEYAQIKARLDEFLEDVKALQLNLSSLRTVLKKPLRPAWITPETDPSDCRLSDATSEFYPVVCCTASRRSSDSGSSSTYIQGAGDDSESWSYGLTSTVFWRHHHELLDAEEGELPGLIQTFMNSEKDRFKIEDLVLITPMKNMYIGNLAAVVQARDFDVVIVCTEVKLDIIEAGKEQLKGKILDLKCGSGKLGSRALRAKLPDVPAFMMALTSGLKCPKILFACSTGNDLAVGVALVVLCLFVDDNSDYITSHLFGEGSHGLQAPSPMQTHLGQRYKL